VPSPVNPPAGCRFRTRCPLAADICKEAKPEFREYFPGHFAACHFAEVSQHDLAIKVGKLKPKESAEG
jgi:ABC-type antimicrobial peptide transport system ATPase subunit